MPHNSPAEKKYRVIQWGIGNVGTIALRHFAHNPAFEVVGVLCNRPEKVGKDAGELVGTAPIGVLATGTVEEIIAAQPDVVTFHGVWPDLDVYVPVLEAGISIVTTADWITGHHRDANKRLPDGRTETEVIAAACEKGRSTFYAEYSIQVCTTTRAGEFRRS